jgi:PAS domain S-box-containing protein
VGNDPTPAIEIYRHTIECQPSLIGRTVADTTLTFLNEAYVRFLGKDRSELIGRRWLGFLPERDRMVACRCLRSITPEEPLQQFEMRSQGGDGSASWHHLWHVCGLFDAAGRLLSYQLIGIDISRWKNAERALRKSERDLAAAQRIAHLGSWVWNLETGEMDWSDEVYRIFGYKPGAIKPESAVFSNNAHPEDRGEIAALFRAAMEQAAPFRKEFRIVCPDGGERHLSVHAEVRTDSRHRPTQMVGTILDISERARAEMALRRSKEFLDHVLDAIEEDVFVKDESHSWVVLNKAACRQIGGRREELLGKSDFDFFSEPQARLNWEKDRQVLQSGETISYQWTIEQGGERRTLSAKKSFFADSATGRKYVVGIARDITDDKNIEAALFEEKER